MTMLIAMPMRRLRSLVAWLDESTGSARARPPPSSAAFREPPKARTYQHGRRASAPDEGGRRLSHDVTGTRTPGLRAVVTRDVWTMRGGRYRADPSGL